MTASGPGLRGPGQEVLMVGVSTYLNFDGCAEQAMETYRALFGTDYATPVVRMGDAPGDPSAPPLTEEEARLVMHAALPILGGHVLMATDLIASRGHRLRLGNNMTINLELDDRSETERLFAALCDGGSDVAGLADMPWGAYWGTCADRYGVRWMFNCTTDRG